MRTGGSENSGTPGFVLYIMWQICCLALFCSTAPSLCKSAGRRGEGEEPARSEDHSGGERVILNLNSNAKKLFQNRLA